MKVTVVYKDADLVDADLWSIWRLAWSIGWRLLILWGGVSFAVELIKRIN